MTAHNEAVALLHLDADTYESTAYFISQIEGYIRRGTVLIIDECHGYPNWQKGEIRAWHEFGERVGLTYR